MRAVFSLLGLLIVVAVIGMAAKRQLASTSSLQAGSVASRPAGTESPQQFQQRVKGDVEKALKQGEARASDAGG